MKGIAGSSCVKVIVCLILFALCVLPIGRIVTGCPPDPPVEDPPPCEDEAQALAQAWANYYAAQSAVAATEANWRAKRQALWDAEKHKREMGRQISRQRNLIGIGILVPGIAGEGAVLILTKTIGKGTGVGFVVSTTLAAPIGLYALRDWLKQNYWPALKALEQADAEYVEANTAKIQAKYELSQAQAQLYTTLDAYNACT